MTHAHVGFHVALEALADPVTLAPTAARGAMVKSMNFGAALPTIHRLWPGLVAASNPLYRRFVGGARRCIDRPADR